MTAAQDMADRVALRAFIATLSDYRLGAALMHGGGFFAATIDDDGEALDTIAMVLGRAADAFGLGPGIPGRWRGAALHAAAEHRRTPEAASDLGRSARLAVGGDDGGEPLTFEPRFNNGRGGASITICGRTRFVEGRLARELAEALDPRRRPPAGDDVAEAARRRGSGP